MAVEEITRLILGHVLYWSHFLLSLALIYSLFMLFLGGKGGVGEKFGSLFGGGGSGSGDGGSWWNPRKKKRRDEEEAGPEDASDEAPKGWQGGFANVTVWVTDEDDNGIQGAFVTIKHQKLPRMSRKRRGRTGPDGTYGPKRIPAGGIMVKASKRNFIQVAVAAGAGKVLLGSILGPIGGAAAGAGFMSTDRYVMKDWEIVEPDEDKLFQIRLHRKQGQKDHGFRPFIELILDTEDKESTRIQGRIDGGRR